METSSLGIDFIKSQEGFSEFVYWDYKQWSIGYGTTVGEFDYPEGITENEATLLLINSLAKYETPILDFADKYNVALSQPQFDALVSFTYTLGGGIWADKYEDFMLRQYLREGLENFTRAEITQAFENWRYAGGVELPGLLARRTREAVIFQSFKGDANGDGQIDIDDIIAVRDHVFGTPLLTNYALWRADCTGDGRVNVEDILAMRDLIFGA